MLKRILSLLPVFLAPVALGGEALLPESLPPPIASEELSYSGAATISMCLLYGGAGKEFTQRTGFHFRSVDSQSGTGRGLEKLLAGKVSLAGVARTLTNEERQQGLVSHLIGHDTIALWVNADNPVSGLSVEQAKGLYSGKIKNWKEVGGEDLSISIFIEPFDAGKATPDVLRETLLGSTPFAPPHTVIDDTRDLLIQVAQDRNGLCAASVGVSTTLSSRIRSLIRPLSLDGQEPSNAPRKGKPFPLTRPLYLVTKGPARGQSKAFIDFMLSPPGQAILARYFIPLSS